MTYLRPRAARARSTTWSRRGATRDPEQRAGTSSLDAPADPMVLQGDYGTSAASSISSKPAASSSSSTTSSSRRATTGSAADADARAVDLLPAGRRWTVSAARAGARSAVAVVVLVAIAGVTHQRRRRLPSSTARRPARQPATATPPAQPRADRPTSSRGAEGERPEPADRRAICSGSSRSRRRRRRRRARARAAARGRAGRRRRRAAAAAADSAEVHRRHRRPEDAGGGSRS